MKSQKIGSLSQREFHLMQDNTEQIQTGRGRRRWMRRLVLIVIATYAGVCMMFAAFQRQLIYYPTREYEGTPRDLGMAYEDVAMTTGDGEKIAGWYVPAPDAQATVLFCHGNAGNISHRLHGIQLLHHAGFNVFIFDYRGFGQSTGTPDEAGLYIDAVAAWDYLVKTRSVPKNKIIILGRSLGGAVAIELATRVKPVGLIVEATFTRMAEVARHLYPLIPTSLFLSDRYDSIDKIAQIACPKLILHGSQDTLIPFDMGRKLFEAAIEPKQFIETPGDHNESGYTYSPAYTDQLVSFIHDTLGL